MFVSGQGRKWSKIGSWGEARCDFARLIQDRVASRVKPQLFT